MVMAIKQGWHQRKGHGVNGFFRLPKNHNLFLRYYANKAQGLQLSRAGCHLRAVPVTRKWLYLDMFDTTAYKLARLVQIPRYVKYLRGGNKQCIKYWLIVT